MDEQDWKTDKMGNQTENIADCKYRNRERRAAGRGSFSTVCTVLNDNRWNKRHYWRGNKSWNIGDIEWRKRNKPFWNDQGMWKGWQKTVYEFYFQRADKYGR